MSAAPELPPAGTAPEEAIRFFRSKGYAIGFSWQDIFRDEHARVFTVAKAMSRDLLEEIREAVDTAIADGTTLDTFKMTLRPKLEARGWWGKKRVIDPATGQTELAQLGSPQRLATIFDTNVRTAYAAGKWERIQRTKAAFPFIEYSSMMDGKERPQHHAWNGTILPADDPWWDTHYPPCAWRCRCWPIQRSQRMLDRQDKTVTDQPVAFPHYTWHNRRTGETGTAEQGIAKGWDYNVGKEYLRGLAPSPLPESFDGADEVGASVQLTGGQTATINTFLDAFNIGPGKEAIWTDRDGWPLSIGCGWFLAPGNVPRVPKRAMVAPIATAITAPDAIDWVWVAGLDGRAMLFRRYRRSSAGVATIVDIGREGWRYRIAAADREQRAA
ncbi:phage minor head protein [Sphingomonas sp. AR_OL41]|uniref:phage head morphogenesis protein n=1 Tax=Sphingomonas sp. AR_OL41 TaxID=3042729 RepID=UPI0024802A24|nr:phage minor head protein [Sphingomonas sp. AR_OL41]MDH7971772.1 phage minor head protein [Sphingomonas sp. AR_OL41]